MAARDSQRCGSRRLARRGPRALRHFRPLPSRDAKYNVNAKALERWSSERLSLESKSDGTIDARFRYDGTTCTNMGRPLAYDYYIKLGPREAGYPILSSIANRPPATPATLTSAGT